MAGAMSAVALALALALAGCGGGGTATSTSPAPPLTVVPAPTPTPTPTPTPAPTGDIRRDLKVAFIGSSVMNGVGASSAGSTFSTLVTQYLDTRFLTVDSRVFAASRTDAEFGAYRIDSDLSRAAFVPDYAFVSFTNDTSDSRAIKTFQDAIIYKLRQVNADVVVVFVAVTRADDEAERRKGIVPARVVATRELASTEGVGVVFVDAGAALWDKVVNGGQSAASLVVEGFPTDAGYKAYADAVIAYLDPRVATLAGSGTKTSAYIADTKLQNARLVDVANVTEGSCSAYTEIPDYYLKKGMVCGAGQSFSLTFSGTTLGITRATVEDGGVLSCTVDGGSPVTIDFYEGGLGGPDLTAVRPIRVFEELSNAAHRVDCTVGGASTAGSSGSRVIIGSFFVSSGRLLES